MRRAIEQGAATLTLTLALLLHAPAAHAQSFTNVYFFGASGEDTGNFTPTHADAQLGLGLVSSYGYDPDRWTNAGGQLWAERFAAALGHSAISSADGGTNYARGGAVTDELAAQVTQFSTDHAGVADPDALYVVSGGGNDMLQGLPTHSAVNLLISVIQRLSDLGATHFLIRNLPDYGPLAPGTGPLAALAPIPDNASAWADAFATELSAALSTLSGLTIYEFDAKGLLEPVFADPVAHGFSAGLALCVNDPDCVAGVGVDDHVMFDHLHLTSAGWALFAQGALAVVRVCTDGLDNDGDGVADYPADPGCASEKDPKESSGRQCDNGLDDDGDGRIDWRGDGSGDPECASLTDDTEARPVCDDGLDNDGDGLADFPADRGCAGATDPDEHSSRQCDNGFDDDFDGRIDWRSDGTGDPHCTHLADQSEFPPPAFVVSERRLRVTTFDDELNRDGDCSLREALQAANTDAAVDACPAGAGPDTLLLRAGSYFLSAGPLVITSDIALRGTSSAASIIDAAQRSSVVSVFGGTVELTRLTLQNGRDAFGAGIFNLGTLTLQRSVVRGNTADFSNGGIENHGTLAIVDSSVVENVAARDFNGGIWNTGVLTLQNSTVSGNTANRSNGGIANQGAMEIVDSSVVDNVATREFQGGIWNGPGATLALVDSTLARNRAGRSIGGINNEGTAAIVNSSVVDNVATQDHSGIYNAPGATLSLVDSTLARNTAGRSVGGITNEGTVAIVNSSVVGNVAVSEFIGGLFNTAGATLTLLNSTVSGNSAAFAIGAMFSFGELELVHSTVTGNFTATTLNGGIFAGDGSRVRLKNSIVAENSSRDCTGPIVSAGHNLAGDNTCNPTGPGDLPGVDPLLGPLADNGGPTETHALLPGSPAIDAIAVADCTDLDGDPVATDQRGVARPQGAGCDVGAFERE